MFGRNNKLDTGWLADVALFEGFSEEQLRQVAELGTRVEAEAGAEITDQGRYGDQCFVIVEGTANVIMNGEYVASVGSGSMIGEMSLLEHRPRSATVEAETDMVLVSFDINGFHALLDANPTAKERVLGILSKRVADNERRRQS
jgi:CRP-like cAMP-binding protein